MKKKSPLTQKVLKEWVKKLRSGRYKQGEGNLRSKVGSGGAKYCCLGVLAQTLGAIFREKQTMCGLGQVPFFKGERVDALNAEGGFLSPAFCGIPRKTQELFANMNDGTGSKYRGRSFDEIADYIEKRYIK